MNKATIHLYVILLLTKMLFRPSRLMAFPVPREYQRIHHDLYRFLETARDLSDVETTHRSYTMCQSVLQVFRKRLTLEESIRFANVLPAGIRALYVADWDPSQQQDGKPLPFESNDVMTWEVQHDLRPTHNFAPDSAIQDVARALRASLEDTRKFEGCLQELGEEAQIFWELPEEIER